MTGKGVQIEKQIRKGGFPRWVSCLPRKTLISLNQKKKKKKKKGKVIMDWKKKKKKTNF